MTNITTEAWPTTPDVNLMLKTQYRVYDGMLALGFCLCLLIGLPGNCLALKFFVQSEKRNLPTLLYITASSIDIISSVIHLPLVVNLLNKRNPGALGHKLFCSGTRNRAFFDILVMNRTIKYVSIFFVTN